MSQGRLKFELSLRSKVSGAAKMPYFSVLICHGQHTDCDQQTSDQKKVKRVFQMSRVGRHLKHLLVLLGIMLVAQMGVAQKDVIATKGAMKQHGSSKKLSGVTITLLENGTQKQKVITSSNGKFDLQLAYDKQYKILFEKVGYISKNILVDSRNIPPEEKERGWFEIPFETSLLEEVEGLDASIFNQPIGKFSFDADARDIVHDAGYTAEMQNKIKSLMKEYERKKKEEEAKRIEEEEAARLEAERLAAAEGAFNEFVEKGDDASSREKYKDAVDNYQAALDLIPNDGIAKDKLATAQEKLKAQEDALADQNKLEEEARLLKEKYDAFIKTADDYFDDKEYEKAKGSYQNAIGVDGSQQYPKDQVAESDRLLADGKAEADRLAKEEAEYAALIQGGDDKKTAKDYDNALASYQSASELRPTEKYPKEQIKEVQKLILDAKAEAEAVALLEQEYAGMIATADQAYDIEDWEKAKNSYIKALDVKPEEQYPQDRIASAEAKIAEILAAKDAAERLEADYIAAVKAGDEALSDEKYQDALTSYATAHSLKTEEAYPNDQIAAVNKLLGDAQVEQDRLAKLDADYQAAVTEADQFFESNNFQDAVTSYEKAAALKEGERYPKDQIIEANKLIAKKASYDDFVAQGDNAISGKDYSTAITAFEKAGELFPSEAYPKDKIAEVTKILIDAQAEQDAAEQLKADYEAAIKLGDRAYSNEGYTEAKTAYQTASDLKGDESYPREQIAAIDAIIAEQQSKAEQAEQLEKDYLAAITEADQFFESNDFEASITSYEKAAAFKGDERYPKDQIVEANKRITKKASYDDFVAQGDNAISGKDYSTARTAFEKAGGLFPSEAYPKDKIAEIDRIVVEAAASADAERQLQLDYEAAMKAGDQSRSAKEYQEALTAYRGASELKPAEQLPKDKIAEMEKVIGDMQSDAERLAALEAEYQRLITDADAKMGNKDYEGAIPAYQKASDVKPELTYPRGKIKEAEIAMANLERNEADRLAQEERDATSQEDADRLAEAEKERLALEAANNEERAELERLERERLAKAEADRLASESANAEERAELDRLERERLAKEEADRLAREEAERLAREADMANNVVNTGDRYFGVRTDDQSETAAEALMREALMRDEADKYERIRKLKARENGFYESLTQADIEEIYLADDHIDRIKVERSELLQGKNSSYAENAEDIIVLKEDRLGWNSDLESGARDDRVDVKQDLVDTEAVRIDQFADKDEPRVENAEDILEYKTTLQEWDADLITDASDQHIDAKQDIVDREAARIDQFADKDEPRIENAEDIIDYKTTLEEWDADLIADANDQHIDAKQDLVDIEAARIDQFADKEEQRIENAEDIVEYKTTLEEWDADLITDANDQRIDAKQDLVDTEAARIDQFADKDELRIENAEDIVEYKTSLEEWDADLITDANDQRIDAKQDIVDTEAARIDQFADKDEPRVENAEDIVEYKTTLEEWEADLVTDASEQRLDTKQDIVDTEVARADQFAGKDEPRVENGEDIIEYKATLENRDGDLIASASDQHIETKQQIVEDTEMRTELVEGYADARRERIKDFAEYKEVLSNVSAEQVQDEAADRDEANLEIIEIKDAASKLLQGENSQREDYIENVDAQEAGVEQLLGGKELTAAKQRLETKEKLDNIEFAQPKSYDDYYLSQLAKDFQQGVTEETYTQPNKIIVRRVVVRGNKADDYHKVIAKWGTYYFQNGRSIAEHIWKRDTLGPQE
jgi:tetratricopeptide (TPR) repeat protein